MKWCAGGVREMSGSASDVQPQARCSQRLSNLDRVQLRGMTPASADRSTKTILGVDDSEETQTILRALIKGAGYSYVSALNADEAMALLDARGPFDVILLDVQLPGTDGYELCKRMRQSSKATSTPVIFVTVNNTVEDVQRSKRVGGNAFIVKPFNTKTLIRHLDHWCFARVNA